MQDAGSASTAFGRIRSFDSILDDIDTSPGHVKPQAKKESKKKNKTAPKPKAAPKTKAAPPTKAAPKTKKLPKEAAPEAAPGAAPKKKTKKLGPLGVFKKAIGPYKSTPMSRAYSSSYHKEYNRLKRLGKDKKTCRLEAGVVGRAAAAVVKTAAAAAP